MGYRSVAIPGLPFDQDTATIPHHQGRIDRRRNEYVVGWIKRGPTGVIGTNKKDSQDTVDRLIADLHGTTLADLGPEHSEELMQWLLQRQPAIEATLARRHLTHGTLVLYDVSSSYMEGRCCPLAKRGYSRDGKKGTLQIIYGLLCAPDGCPVAIEVFDSLPRRRPGATPPIR